ncbi:MAG: hypothetical protein JWO38_2936 [Gemmataceae bacterium]|nr:hypothetical protein [Gemmataceae bacterium]
MSRAQHFYRLFFVAGLVACVAPPAPAAPRDEVLRVAPPDAAFVLLLQNARDHVRDVANSPFVEWVPKSVLGRQLFAAGDLKHVREAAAPLFLALGVTSDDLLNEVFGDAVVFAYTPAPPDDPKAERAVVLVRPRKPDMLAKLVERLNAIQTGTGEVKSVTRRQHNGEEYFERQKPGGGSDFYCFRGDVFAFSGTEPDILAVIDRDKAAPPAGVKPPGLVAKLAKLGVADAFAVALINPRPLDAELAAKVAGARAAEKEFLTRFQEVWRALDSAAVYFSLGADLEAGVSLQFRPGALPAPAKGWLTGPRTTPEIWQSVPDDALFAAAGRFKAAEVIDLIGALVPVKEKNPVTTVAERFLGPVFGRDKLPRVFDALGPNWAVWAEPPPRAGGSVPVVVAAVQIDAGGPNGKETVRAIARSVGFGFEAARVAYNSGHTDQIDLEETQDGDVVITSLVGEKAFPPGIRPSFALKDGYLVLAGSPDAVKRFRRPAANAPQATGESLLARVSGPATRTYLATHREKLAEFLATAKQGDQKNLLKQIDQFAAVLELIDRVELVGRGDEGGIRLALRAKLVKPLKK